jgi:hypothetical protein
MNGIGLACSECHFFRANLLNRDLCEQNNCRQKPQVVLHAMSFFKERLFIREK